ncbi:PRMT5 arginine-N-methyltransferase-domain-containing protein [Dipodascopsis uninucleata]
MCDQNDARNTELFYVGIEIQCNISGLSVDSDRVLSYVGDGYDIVMTPITTPEYRSKVTELIEQADYNKFPYVAPPNLTEVSFAPNTASMQHIYGISSNWLELDSADDRVASISAQVLHNEVSYAAFCGLGYVIVPGPRRRTNVAQYSQAINSVLNAIPYVNICIHLPMTEEHRDENEEVQSTDLSIWEIWNSIRTLCDYPSRLSISLQVPVKLPAQNILARWFAEPVSVLIISAKIFLRNSKGYPVLSKAHQYFLFKFLKQKPYTILQDVKESIELRSSQSSEPEIEESAFLIYIRHLHKVLPPPSAMERFGQGYQDLLQNPLQPLADNLESGTYEVFERDPVKYMKYEKAIERALADKHKKGQTVILAIAGAGRGPLVTRALKASEEVNVPVYIYAVEKNPNAYTYLLQRKSYEWQSNVEVIYSDMRSWQPDSKVDIVISELLGSFGDNELSPECLDGVEHVLKDDGVMIPQSYSAYLVPACSPKLHMSIKAQNKEEAANTAYVVMLQAVDLLSTDIKKAWSFSHPSPDNDAERVSSTRLTRPSNIHNTRHAKLRFDVSHRGVMHGFAGYFESVLYRDIELSTKPDTMGEKSKDMVSWFPIWFPLQSPIFVPDSSEIEISIWRKTDDSKVWYEWSVETFLVVPLLNELVSTRTSESSSVSNPSIARRRIRLETTVLHNFSGKHSYMRL